MDKTRPGKEGAREVTRESLIALSYIEPEKVVTSKLSSETPKQARPVKGIDHDVAEKYRSELISISYSQSPDNKDLPVTENLDN